MISTISSKILFLVFFLLLTQCTHICSFWFQLFSYIEELNLPSVSLVFQVKDARDKLGLKDARFKIRGRGGGASGGLQDARQMINSRKQGQSPFSGLTQSPQFSAATQQLQSQNLVPQIKIQTVNNLASGVVRQFTPSVHGLSVRGSVAPQQSANKRIMDARDRLSLKRSIGGTQTAAAPPLKITKTIQVSSFLIKRNFRESQSQNLSVCELNFGGIFFFCYSNAR